MSSGKKEYTLKINGISQSINDVTKLEDVLNRLDSTIGKVNQNTATSTQTTRQRTAALSEEEKAEKKLAETIDKAVRARTEANRAQIDANQAAREAQRQAVLEQQAVNASANSVEEMRAKLALMKNEWKGLDVGSQKFRELSEEINALNNKIKEAEQSTGDFRRNVGNYPNAMAGLEKLSQGIDGASKSSMGFAQSLMATNQFMAMFGGQTEEGTKQAKELQKIMALLAIIQGVNNNLLKNGIIQNKAAAIVDGIRTIQLRAKTAAEAQSTKGTIAATIAQKAFNLVAKANPYVLLALALVAVVGALVAFSSGADDATDSAGKYKSMVDGVTFATKEARDAHDGLIRKIRDIQVEIDLANGKLTEYQANLLRISNRGADAADEVRKKYAELREEIEKEYEPAFYNKNPFTGEATGYFHEQNEKEKAKKLEQIAKDEAKELSAIQNATDKESENQNAAHNAAILKQNEDNRIANLKGLDQSLAQIDRARTEELTKAKKDNETAIELNKKLPKEQQIAVADLAAINKKYDAQRDVAIKDANKKAADAGKAAQDRRKADLEKQKAIFEKERDLLRKAEDDKTSLIVNEFDRRRAEVDAKYARQREDLQRQLDTDTSLTEKGREAIRAVIANIDAHIKADREKIRKDELEKEKEAEAKKKEILDKKIADADRRNSLLLSGLELTLETAEEKIGDLTARSKGGLELIDVDQTRKNLKEANDALDEYIAGLKKAQETLKATHEETLRDLQKGTPEYEEELQKYAQANLELNRNLKNANKQREDNTKASNEAVADYFKDLFKKIGEYAEAAVMAIDSVTSTISMGLQVQIDELNEQLDAVNERYEEAQKNREESVKRIEQLEADLQSATGGTAEALKQQLQDEMHYRAEAEREEQRLAKEKEKREAEIAKKEKQQKRADMISNIAQAIANTAQGVTKALGLIFPLNLVVAGLVGAMGAVQVGIMTKQLTKMADGGLIEGPSHAQGGARIQGTNIEVEGGEYVINKASTAANTELISFINDARGPVSFSDLVGVVPGDNTPVVINEVSRSSEDKILEAIDEIEFSPVVSVVDIIDTTDDVVTVRDLSGF